jgi:hypothetical protein
MTTYTTRAAAGAAYQAAAQAYFDQWVELAAWDRASNAVRSFAAQPAIAPHAEFLTSPPGNTLAPILARHAALEAAGGLVKQSVGGPPSYPASSATFGISLSAMAPNNP